MAKIFYPGMKDWLDRLNELAEGQLVPIQADWEAAPGSLHEILNKPELAVVATSGSKSDIGLGNADNTSDANKPVSILQAAALAGKASLNGDPTKNFNASSLNGGPLGGIRNKILNPAFRVNVRGITVGSVDSVYITDCWRIGNSGVDGLVNYGINVSSPVTINGSQDMYIQTGATAKPVLAVTDYTSIGSAIEGYDAADMLFGTPSAKSITFSFRAYASAPTVITVVFRNKDSTRSYVALVSLVTSTQSYSITIPGDVNGTWGKTDDIGISFRFFLACGTNYHTATPNSWISGNAFGHSSMSNIMDTVNRYVQIADVQLEVGATPTSFSTYGQAEEITRCQRYCEAGDAPVSFSNGGGTNVTAAYGEVVFKTAKRIPPSILLGTWRYYSVGTETNFAPGLSSITENRFVFTAGSLVQWYGWAPGGAWLASSDL